MAYIDHGYTGERPAENVAPHGMPMEVIKLPEAKKAFAPTRRWAVSAALCRRSFNGLSRFRRLARDDERLSETLAELHAVAFDLLMLPRFIRLVTHLRTRVTRSSQQLGTKLLTL